MKTLSLTLTLVTVTALSVHTFAQKEPIQIGAKATIMRTNANSHGINLGLDLLKPQSVFSPGVSVFADIPVGTNGFYFSPAIGYQQQGFEVGESITLDIFEIPVPVGASARVRTQSLQFSPDLKYKFGSGNVKGYVRGGPYVSYAVDGKTEIMVNSIIDIRVATIPFNTNGKLYQPWEVGAGVGAGVEIGAGPGNLILEANYQHAFTDFTDVPLVDVGLKNYG